MEASHAGNVGDVVLAIGSQATAHGQKLLRQRSASNPIALWLQDLCQSIFGLLMDPTPVQVGGRHDERYPCPIPGEGEAGLRVWNGNHDQRSGLWQAVGRAEDKAAEILAEQRFV